MSSLPPPSSTSETKSIKSAPSRQTYCVPETSSAAMQNTAFYGSWPLNLNQYAWSPEALQQYQNMLLTDPTLQPQMHQPQTHPPLQPQPMQHTPHSTPPATHAASTPPPPPPPPPPSFSSPSAPVTSSPTHPPATYSQPTPPASNMPYRTPSTAPTPTTWKPDSQHYDSNPLHGNPLFRQIQPTAWSRARNVHGMDPLLLPAASLLRQGQEDYSLRLLSAGRYMGLIPTRNIAESVLMSMLLKNMREKNLFIDDMAQSLHELAGQSVPSKKDQAIQYTQPLVDSIVTHLQSIQPPQVKAQQLHQIHQLQAQLAKQTEKLRTHGIPPTPEKTQRRHSKTTRASTNPSAPSHTAPTPPPPTPPSPDYLPETPSPSPALHPSPPTPGALAEPTPRPAQKATTKAAPRKRQASLQPTPPSQSRLPFSKRPRHASPPASIPAPSPSPLPIHPPINHRSTQLCSHINTIATSSHPTPRTGDHHPAHQTIAYRRTPYCLQRDQNPKMDRTAQQPRAHRTSQRDHRHSCQNPQERTAQLGRDSSAIWLTYGRSHFDDLQDTLSVLRSGQSFGSLTSTPPLHHTTTNNPTPTTSPGHPHYSQMPGTPHTSPPSYRQTPPHLHPRSSPSHMHFSLCQHISTSSTMETVLSSTSHHTWLLHPLSHATNTGSLHQTPISPLLTPNIPPDWPLLHRQHQHWHIQAGIQPPSQTQTAPRTQDTTRGISPTLVGTPITITNNTPHYFYSALPTTPKHGPRNMPSFSNTDHPSTFHTSSNIYTAQHLPFTSNPTNCISLEPTQPYVYGDESEEPPDHYTATRHLQNNKYKAGPHFTTLPLSTDNGLKPANNYDPEPLQTGTSMHYGDLHNTWNNQRDPDAFQNFATFSTSETVPSPKGTNPWHYRSSAIPLSLHK